VFKYDTLDSELILALKSHTRLVRGLSPFNFDQISEGSIRRNDEEQLLYIQPIMMCLEVV
jgi:hypothetical protein